MSKDGKKENIQLYDAFICYARDAKSVDEDAAITVYSFLQSRGLNCWFYKYDGQKGEGSEGSILKAIKKSKLLVLVYTAQTNSSIFVENEIRHASRCNVPIIPFKIEDVPYNSVLDFYLNSHNWLDATIPPLDFHLQKLAEDIAQLTDTEISIPSSIAPDQKLLQHKQSITKQKGKKPLLAALLSLLLVGSGQIYNGHIKKGFALMSITYIVSIFLFILSQAMFDWKISMVISMISFAVLFSSILIPLSCWIYSMYDAYNNAKHYNGNIEAADWFSNISTKKGVTWIVIITIFILLSGLSMNNYTAVGWYDKGYNLNRDGQYNESLQAFNKAIELNSQFGGAWSGKGLALYNLGKYDESLQAFDKAIEIDPLDVDSWTGKGKVLDKLGKHEEAIVCYNKTEELLAQKS